MRWIERITSRRAVVVGLWILVLMLVASVAFAQVATKTPAPKTPKPSATSEGVHGGPQPRIHTGCTLASGLTGNWTHGDYVSAVAKANPADSEKIRAAAHSNCGKVDHSKQQRGRSAEHKPS